MKLDRNDPIQRLDVYESKVYHSQSEPLYLPRYIIIPPGCRSSILEPARHLQQHQGIFMDKETRQQYEELEKRIVQLRNKLLSMDPMDDDFRLISSAFSNAILQRCLLEDKDNKKYRKIDSQPDR